MDKETLSNYGWIVICVLVLAVMIALATPFGNYIKDAVQNTTQGLFDVNQSALNSTGLINIGDQSFGEGGNGGNGGAGGATPNEPNVRNGIIPTGATYTPNRGTAIVGNGTNTFPETPQTGDTYEEGDYTYKYNYYFSNNGWRSDSSQNGWGVRVNDTSKTEYGEIISEIAGKALTSMCFSFYNCTSLTTAPTIPSSVTDMGCTFDGCTSLTTAPKIPNNVTNMSGIFSGCISLKTYVESVDPDGDFSSYTISDRVTNIAVAFRDCTSLTTAPTIPSSVTNMDTTFDGCTSLTTAPIIPNSVTSMMYTFKGCTSLTGTIEINANPTDYGYCFSATSKPITLTGSSTMLSQLANTANNGNVTTTSGSNPVTPDVSIQVSSTVTNAPASVTVSVSSEEGGYDYNNLYKPAHARIIKFCPTTSGEYVFAGQCDGDTCAAILDENMTVLGEDDDGNGNSDFSIIYYCTAGNTYYLAVGMYYYSESGTITVNISKN